MSRRLQGLGQWLLLVLMASPARANAHPIHTTFTEVQVTGGTATFTVRAFADDLAVAVARFHGRRMPRDSAVGPADAARYLGAMLQVRTAAGAASPVMCGVRRAGALTYLCVQYPWRDAAQVTNRLLSDLHPDQVNVMQQRSGRTWVFTRATAIQSLPR